MRRLSNSILLALSLILLPACSSGEADKPLATFQGDGFTVSMPGSPERTAERPETEAGPIEVVLYTSEGSDNAYSVGYSTLPSGVQADLAAPIPILSAAVQGAAKGVGGTAQDEVDSTLPGPAGSRRADHGWLRKLRQEGHRVPPGNPHRGPPLSAPLRRGGG